ncbi:MAG: hypothetical protein ACI4KF_11110 [Huintestinicola sp.]
MKKAGKGKISGFEVLMVLYIVILLPFISLPDILGLYDNMIGMDGLKSTVLAIILRNLCGVYAAFPCAFIGICILKNMKKKDDVRNSPLVFGGMIFLTIVIPVMLFLSVVRTRYSEQIFENGSRGPFEDIRLATACVSDMIADEYDEYTIASAYFDTSRHVSSTGRRSGRRSSSFHNEYTISGTSGELISQKVFTAQIGKNNYNELKDSLPKGFEIYVTVYKNSRFIRSIEPSVNYSKSESYEHIYELSVINGKITYTKISDSFEMDNLTWCGFHVGESGDIHNSLFGIGADKSSEYPYSMGNFDEICLYAVCDGGYRRVSNIIYKEELQ